MELIKTALHILQAVLFLYFLGGDQADGGKAVSGKGPESR